MSDREPSPRRTSGSAPPVHLLIEAVGHRSGGGAVVLVDLVNAALADTRVSIVTTLTSPAHRRSFTLPVSDRVVDLPQNLPDRFLPLRLLWLMFVVERIRRRVGADVAISMTGQGRFKAPGGAVFVQQPMPFYVEARRTFSFSMRARFAVIRWMMNQAASAANLIVVQTDEMRRQVYQKLGVEPSKIEVLAPTVELASAGDVGMPAQLDPMTRVPEGVRLVYVGSDQPHKNVRVVVDAMPRVRATIPGATLFLTWPTDHPVAARPGVVCLGPVPREQLGIVYGLASVLCQPSLAETAGLPMLESMKCGLPVIAADRPFARAMCGDAALFFDPHDSSDLATKIAIVLNESGTAERMRRKGRAIMAAREEFDPYRSLIGLLTELRPPSAAS